MEFIAEKKQFEMTLFIFAESLLSDFEELGFRGGGNLLKIKINE